MVQTGYCPRGPFCAFAHVERKFRIDFVVKETCYYEHDKKKGSDKGIKIFEYRSAEIMNFFDCRGNNDSKGRFVNV